MLAGALYLMHPVIALNASGGMETSIFLTVLLTIALAVGSRRFDLALIATALLPWIRIDGVVAVPVIAAMWWRAGRPAIRWGAIGTAAAIVVAYAVFTSLVYDTLIPQSALSKLGESYGRPVEAMTVAVSFIAAVAGLSSTFYWYLTPQVLLLIGLAWKLASWRVHPAEQALLLIAFLHAFAYIIPGRAYAINFPWYFVPFVALTILPSVDALIEVGHRFRFKPLPRVVLLVLCAGLLACVVAAFGLRYVDGFLESMMNVLPSAKRLLQEPRRLDSVRQILFGNLLLAGGILIALIAGTEAIRRARSGAFQAGLGFFLAILMIAPIYLSRKHVIEKYERREASYLALGRWVSDHIAPEELIGATEIGAFGWGAIDNTVYDEWGLVTKGAKGVSRTKWVAALQPAVALDLSTTGERRKAREPTQNYVAITTDYNRFYLRKDLLPAWAADPAKLE